MPEIVRVFPKDATYIRIEASPAVDRELSENFSFMLEGSRFMPSVRSGRWDGRIRLYKKGLLYAGLVFELEKFCSERNYSLEVLTN